ncbi:hypothetical protein [Actinokineospora inagensis]|uniref:hypothetical protein n=1 Tax=Actinokineospora inagensis TaxID=103730 RepID=UPI000424B2F8|nr:hypothetical protein [Actinokineospora inagensis]
MGLRAVTAVAVVVVAFTAGCSSSEPPKAADPAHEPPLGEVATVRETYDLVLPLDSYRATAEQLATIGTANDMLVQQCMRRFGFDTPVVSHENPRQPNRRYGISASDDYANWGYHPSPDQFPQRKANDPNQQKHSDAEWQVFTGRDGSTVVNGEKVPDGGCRVEAGKTLNFYANNDTSHETADDLVQNLSNESNASARGDSRLIAAWANWSKCMDEAGYDYATPWDANDDGAWWKDQNPSDKEIATAKADVGCKEKTNVIGVNLAVETAYQSRLIEKNAEALKDYRVLLDNRIKEATAVVSRK